MKGKSIIIFSLVLIISLSFVSAGLLGNIFGKITGESIVDGVKYCDVTKGDNCEKKIAEEGEYCDHLNLCNSGYSCFMDGSPDAGICIKPVIEAGRSIERTDYIEGLDNWDANYKYDCSYLGDSSVLCNNGFYEVVVANDSNYFRLGEIYNHNTFHEKYMEKCSALNSVEDLCSQPNTPHHYSYNSVEDCLSGKSEFGGIVKRYCQNKESISLNAVQNIKYPCSVEKNLIARGFTVLKHTDRDGKVLEIHLDYDEEGLCLEDSYHAETAISIDGGDSFHFSSGFGKMDWPLRSGNAKLKLEFIKMIRYKFSFKNLIFMARIDAAATLTGSPWEKNSPVSYFEGNSIKETDEGDNCIQQEFKIKLFKNTVVPVGPAIPCINPDIKFIR